MGERRTEYLPLDAVVGAVRNAKRHAEADVQASIGRFGFADSPVLDERTGRLVSGHGRIDGLRALRDAGDAPPDGVEVDERGWLVPVQRGWASTNDLEAEAAGIALNRLTEQGGWDEGELADSLARILDEPLGLEGLGFTADEYAETVKRARLEEAKSRPPAPDDAPPVPAVPTTRPGDLIVLGDHLLYCGDATDPDAYRVLLDGTPADMVWTDPPYGVDYVGKTKDALTIDNDGADDLEQLLDQAFTATLEVTRPGAVWFVAAPPGPQFLAFAMVLARLGVWRQTLCWIKDVFVLGHSDYHYRHEAMFFGWKPGKPRPSRHGRYDTGHGSIAFGWSPGAAHQATPDRTSDTVWSIPRPTRSADHPTMKPVELVARAIRNHSDPDELVLDPFAGSGTTLLACEQEARRARCIELSPGYADVVVARWEAHTGRQAVRPNK